MLVPAVDVFPPYHVPRGDGFPLDWLTDSRLYPWWYPTLHLPRHWWSRSVDLVCARQSAGLGSCMPVRWIIVRSDGQEIRCCDGRESDHSRHDRLEHSS